MNKSKASESDSKAVKYCPVCADTVSYITRPTSGLWVHDNAVGAGHDVNTYAPDRPLTEKPNI